MSEGVGDSRGFTLPNERYRENQAGQHGRDREDREQANLPFQGPADQSVQAICKHHGQRHLGAKYTEWPARNVTRAVLIIVLAPRSGSSWRRLHKASRPVFAFDQQWSASPSYSTRG